MTEESSARSPFSLLLRRYRIDAGLSQEALAERAKLSTRAISDLERGVQRLPYRVTVAQLADALELGEDARRYSSRQRAAPKLLPLPRWKQRVTRCPTLCSIQSSPCLPFARRHSVNNNEIVTARTADQ